MIVVRLLVTEKASVTMQSRIHTHTHTPNATNMNNTQVYKHTERQAHDRQQNKFTRWTVTVHNHLWYN